MTSACHAEDHGFESRTNRHYGFIAQSVEQRTENPCVAGSIPAGATKLIIEILKIDFFLQKFKKILTIISSIASLLILISGIIFLIVAILDEDLDVELAFN